MIEIIPNWHPVWVHFVIALLIIGTLFYALALIGRNKSWSHTLLGAARWNLSFGIGFALIALVTGFLAAGSVPHDDAAHANMMVHRNWAFTAVVIFLVAGILLWTQWLKAGARASAPVLALLLAGSVAVAVTGFEGGQNVFEYGLGVRKLPDAGHHHHHHGDHDHDGAREGEGMEEMGAMDDMQHHEHDETQADGQNQPESMPPASDGHLHDHDHSSHSH